MRADPRDYELAAPGNLASVLSLLAREPGVWTPIAGGTDLMVLFSAGKLAAGKFVSIWNLTDLNQVVVLPHELQIGACCTYTDLRKHNLIAQEFSLLASAAAWTGGIANQNRGTLGGNIVNASPAADSLPALLAYEAKLVLISARGEREVPYVDFHRGYKKHALEPDELIRTVRLSRSFANYFSFTRKIGARKAQAIAKVSIAALGRFTKGRIEDVRIAIGSVAPVPLRLRETERLLTGQKAHPHLVDAARSSVRGQIEPIDDIRSTATYRSAVAGNLVAEFVETFCRQADSE